MKKRHLAAIALFGLLCVAAPALAHHSFTAEFDASRLVAVKGVLTKVEWTNPHAWFYVDVKDENGTVVNWAFETVSPNHVHHQYPDARKDLDANIGKAVSVVGCPAKANPHAGSARSLMLASGKVMTVGLEGTYTGSENADQLLRTAK